MGDKVAGFEPTASSSRSRTGNGRHLPDWLYALVKALVLVGLRRLLGLTIARSPPHSPPELIKIGSLLPVPASRRASFARPGRARLVQVERPAGRTTWTRRARSGCLRC